VTDDRSKLAQAIRFLNREARRDRDAEGHPSPERLAAYHFGELLPEEDRRVQAHLEVCPECTELLLDLGRFLRDESEEAADLTDEQIDAAFGELLARGGLPGSAPASPGGADVVPFERREVDSGPLRTFQALAAVLFLAVVGLGAWGWGMREQQEVLEREVGRLKAPAPAQELSDVSPRGGGPGASGRIVSTKALVLRFSLPKDGIPFEKYEVWVLGPDGRVALSASDLPEADGGVLVSFAPGVLPEGRVHFRLLGVDGGRPVLLREVSVDVVAAE
jgi:hypothetical protein